MRVVYGLWLKQSSTHVTGGLLLDHHTQNSSQRAYPNVEPHFDTPCAFTRADIYRAAESMKDQTVGYDARNILLARCSCALQLTPVDVKNDPALFFPLTPL